MEEPSSEKISNNLHCPVCYQPFNKTKNEPRILLNCGHTICKECLSSEHIKKCVFCKKEDLENSSNKIILYNLSIYEIICKICFYPFFLKHKNPMRIFKNCEEMICSNCVEIYNKEEIKKKFFFKEKKNLEEKNLEKKNLEKKNLEEKNLEEKNLEKKNLEEKNLEEKLNKENEKIIMNSVFVKNIDFANIINDNIDIYKKKIKDEIKKNFVKSELEKLDKKIKKKFLEEKIIEKKSENIIEILLESISKSEIIKKKMFEFEKNFEKVEKKNKNLLKIENKNENYKNYFKNQLENQEKNNDQILKILKKLKKKKKLEGEKIQIEKFLVDLKKNSDYEKFEEYYKINTKKLFIIKNDLENFKDFFENSIMNFENDIFFKKYFFFLENCKKFENFLTEFENKDNESLKNPFFK